MAYTYEYPRPSVTVDVALCRPGVRALEVLLIQRKAQPFRDRWALPGGFVDMEEDLPTAARRELLEETHLEIGGLIELGAYGAVDRDPRGRVVGIVFLAIDLHCEFEPTAGDDAAATRWCSLRRPPSLAFDHAVVLRDVQRRLVKLEAELGDDLFRLLPGQSTIAALHRLHELIAPDPVSRSAYRQRILRTDRLVESGRDGRERRYRIKKPR